MLGVRHGVRAQSLDKVQEVQEVQEVQGDLGVVS